LAREHELERLELEARLTDLMVMSRAAEGSLTQYLAINDVDSYAEALLARQLKLRPMEAPRGKRRTTT
jgi:hypothetical protein